MMIKVIVENEAEESTGQCVQSKGRDTRVTVLNIVVTEASPKRHNWAKIRRKGGTPARRIFSTKRKPSAKTLRQSVPGWVPGKGRWSMWRSQVWEKEESREERRNGVSGSRHRWASNVNEIPKSLEDEPKGDSTWHGFLKEFRKCPISLYRIFHTPPTHTKYLR